MPPGGNGIIKRGGVAVFLKVPPIESGSGLGGGAGRPRAGQACCTEVDIGSRGGLMLEVGAWAWTRR